MKSHNLQANDLPLAPLIVGDVNQDNQIDTQDYNIFMACYGSKQCPSDQKAGSDVNDDGVVDGIDYNLWLKIYSTHPGAG